MLGRCKMIKTNYLGRLRQHFHNNFSQLFSLGEAFERLTDLRHRIDPIHNGPELPLTEPPGDFGVFRRIPHCRAENGPVMPEQPSNVEPDLRSGRRSARDEPAATTQAAERLLPSGGADILDDDIDAAFVGKRADLL